MNSENGSIKIDILRPASSSKVKKLPVTRKKSGGMVGFFFNYYYYCKAAEWIKSVWEFCKEDSNRVIFSMKVGLAVLLVSLLVLFQAPYQVFSTSRIIWSILTVAIMFEYTVGATFNRGAVVQVALFAGHVVEPLIIGGSIFLIGAVTSFMKQWPTMVPFEYGFRVILLTFCLIIISGYRQGNPVRTAIDRLCSIAMGGFVAVLVNVFVCPSWSGEGLHKELVKHFDAVANSLEECVQKYLKDDGSDHPEFFKTVMDEFPDEPAYKRCKATLDSSATIASLANSAKWEPPHGRFQHFFYPWSEYVKVATVLRFCAYEVMALHGVLHSEIQILDASSQAAELVRSLGKDIMNMKRSLRTSLLKRVHSSTERLQRAIDMHSYFLTSGHDSLSDNNSYTTKPLSKQLSHTISSTLSDLTAHLVADQGSCDGNGNGGKKMPSNPTPLQMADQNGKQHRRLHSWPSREMDEFEEGSSIGVDYLPRMRALESTASLSLVTFISLLIEFVARLDHLVEAVDELAKMANFKHDDS